MNPACPRCGRTMRRGAVTAAGRTRWTCRHRIDGSEKYCYSTTDVKGGKHPRNEPEPKMVFRRPLGRVRRLIITSAQNATPVHEGFFKSLETFARATGAELLVIPLRYKNPTSFFKSSQRNEMWWLEKPRLDKEGKLIIGPRQRYLWNARHPINRNLTLLADIKTEAAAAEPLRGFESISGTESGIVGHTKLQLRTIPVPKTKLPKILTTTGAVTVANYTDTKRGKIGEFHHSLSAVVVEFDENIFHMRHVHADKHTGAFTDLDKRYDQRGVRKAPRPLAVITGDTHVDFIDPKVEQATYGPDGLVTVLDPETVIFHDLVDNYAVNPHHIGNPFNAIAKARSGRDDARAEAQRALAYLQSHTSARRPGVVVASNHDDFLRRWIIRTDWRGDPTNAEFYLETALAMVRSAKLGPGGTEYQSPFAALVGKVPHARALGLNESLVLGGVELGMHGELGPNGARGSIRNLRRIGTRSVIGHSHTPGIEEGCYQVGTSTMLRLEYNSGPSSWLNTHCVLHADGKRQLITIIDGTWRMD
jgi:hypothetical protein